jgi:hypothetical protein
VSYIRSKKVDQQEPVTVEYGMTLPEIDFEVHGRGDGSLDMNLEDEILQFVLALIAQVDDLGEGEALVIWKEIF